MVQIRLKVDGMMCGMCESHVNDTIRSAFPVKKVTSSHAKGETIILSENALSEESLRSAVEKLGYRVEGYDCQPYQPRGLLASLFHKQG